MANEAYFCIWLIDSGVNTSNGADRGSYADLGIAIDANEAAIRTACETYWGLGVGDLDDYPVKIDAECRIECVIVRPAAMSMADARTYVACCCPHPTETRTLESE